ncbi:DUF2478 domain-containing protein [Pseudohalocynthiibacter aestuariivivens]|uniref:DUF2478 domain-containing protein n=1 Tax=Pseudohalocynthiibacter aestuariivivens TaxID=1591409 RepID=A0ABV5JGV0_9RHOB|nr:DUF2478 domain-containing protein [Pseudohalocynthiibacter aestuariivivens]MBS9718178.1 DUF2478 domain-containing protein [Pseudohalocynthiibacter aestuariivivens]
MKIARVSSELRGETDRLLTEIATQFQIEGAALVGIVKVMQHESAFENGCDMKVKVLPDGPEIKITQALGKGSDSCRLDPGAIANTVSAVEHSSIEGADLFILNKFGPEEAAGRGFCTVIGSALELGIPVLVGVGGACRQDFDKFVDGLAEALPADQETIRAWCYAAMSKLPEIQHT